MIICSIGLAGSAMLIVTLMEIDASEVCWSSTTMRSVFSVASLCWTAVMLAMVHQMGSDWWRYVAGNNNSDRRRAVAAICGMMGWVAALQYEVTARWGTPATWKGFR